jgi:hypothetical protein
MGDKYFVGVNGEPRGPIELWEVLGLFKQGTITRETPLLKEGWEDWGKVGALPETMAAKEPGRAGGRGKLPPEGRGLIDPDFKMEPMKPGEGLGWVCGLAFIAGIIGVLFFCFGFDVSNGGIANMDAMNQRLLGVLVSVGMILLGGLFLICRELKLLRVDRKK